MAEAPVQTLNEAALKRFDPYIQKVLDVGKYVALYSFENNAWKKSDVEGSLFVYSRSAEPLFNILVLNRLNKNNLVEPITHQVDLQLNSPFLLYKNSKGCIFGIWFFDQSECIRLSSLIQKLIDNSCSENKHQPVPQDDTNVDLFKMLTKAQETYNETKEGRSNHTKASPTRSKVTANSVAEFFAKAGIAPQTAVEAPTTIQQKPQVENEKPSGLLQQLMANAVHTVEHIEKQQRSATPQSNDQVNDVLKQFIRPHSSSATRPDNKETVVENGLKFISLAAESTTEEKKPDLMPPAMFTPRNQVQVQAQPTPEPLTRNQLLQALDYLLRNDVEFVTKVHEAYVKSLTEKIS